MVTISQFPAPIHFSENDCLYTLNLIKGQDQTLTINANVTNSKTLESKIFTSVIFETPRFMNGFRFSIRPKTLDNTRELFQIIQTCIQNVVENSDCLTVKIGRANDKNA